MLWAILAVAAAFIWAVTNILEKFIVSKYVKNPVIPLLFIGANSLLAILAIFAFKGFSSLSTFNIFLAIVTGAIVVFPILLYLKALQVEEVSRVVPLVFLSPLFVLPLAAIFLGEVFTKVKYAGIFLLVIGAVLISARDPRKLHFGKALKFMVAADIIGSVVAVATKYLLNFADFWTVFAWLRIGMVIALLPFLFINFQDLVLLKKKHGITGIGVIAFSEILGMTGAFLATIATQIGSVTLVAAIGSVQPFFVLLFAVILSLFLPKMMKEEIGRRTVLLKLAAIVMMFVGTILII